MTRWFIKAETQLELPLGKEDLKVYYPTLVREISFRDKMQKLKGKNLQYIQKVIYECLNDVSNNKVSDYYYYNIEAGLIEEAFKKFAKMYADDNYKVYDVTISELEKDSHVIKDNTEKRYLICPFVSETKLYDVSEFDTLVKALSIKIFYYLESLNK